MRISREVKAGFIILLAIVGMIWFINFLKGKNILRSGRTFYAVYDDVNGLEPTSAVTINGFRIGRVESIKFHPDLSGRLIVQLQIEYDFQFSKNAIAKVYSPDFLGGKAVSIDISKKGELAQYGDTLPSALERGITDAFSDRLDPMKNKVEHMIVNLDTTLNKVSKLLNEENRENITQILKTLEETSRSLNAHLNENTGDISRLIKTVDKTLVKFSTVADNVNKVNFESTVKQLDQTVARLNTTLEKIEKGEGSIGLLVNDKQLYNNLQRAGRELKELLQDLKENPKRYVHFSVFGKKDKGYQENKE